MEIITKADRVEENELMIDSAHGSRYHWRFITKNSTTSAEWLISRVYWFEHARQLILCEKVKEITDNFTKR
jgi:hypothetical protein